MNFLKIQRGSSQVDYLDLDSIVHINEERYTNQHCSVFVSLSNGAKYKMDKDDYFTKIIIDYANSKLFNPT